MAAFKERSVADKEFLISLMAEEFNKRPSSYGRPPNINWSPICEQFNKSKRGAAVASRAELQFIWSTLKSCTRNKYKEVGDEVANEPLLGDVWAVIKEFSKRPIPSDGVSDGSDGSADASAGGLRRSKRKLYSAEKVGAVHVDVQLPDMQDKEDSQQELLSECDARPALRGKRTRGLGPLTEVEDSTQEAPVSAMSQEADTDCRADAAPKAAPHGEVVPETKGPSEEKTDIEKAKDNTSVVVLSKTPVLVKTDGADECGSTKVRIITGSTPRNTSGVHGASVRDVDGGIPTGLLVRVPSMVVRTPVQISGAVGETEVTSSNVNASVPGPSMKGGVLATRETGRVASGGRVATPTFSPLQQAPYLVALRNSFTPVRMMNASATASPRTSSQNGTLIENQLFEPTLREDMTMKNAEVLHQRQLVQLHAVKMKGEQENFDLTRQLLAGSRKELSDQARELHAVKLQAEREGAQQTRLLQRDLHSLKMFSERQVNQQTKALQQQLHEMKSQQALELHALKVKVEQEAAEKMKANLEVKMKADKAVVDYAKELHSVQLENARELHALRIKREQEMAEQSRALHEAQMKAQEQILVKTLQVQEAQLRAMQSSVALKRDVQTIEITTAELRQQEAVSGNNIAQIKLRQAELELKQLEDMSTLSC